MMKLEVIRLLTGPVPGDSCLVCGGKAFVIGIFQPEQPDEWGGKEGKARLFRYCLCERCSGRKDTPERAEKIIRAEMQVGVSYAGA